MSASVKIGIIICDRYRNCAGGKCFRSLKNREGAFKRYRGKDVEVVGYSTCGGCPGGNIEYVPEEMRKNGATVIHLATGMVVGYPPCPYVFYFKKFIEEKFDIEVVIGTHPIPEKYYIVHKRLRSWEGSEWKEIIGNLASGRETRLKYD